MATKERQILITKIVSNVLNRKAEETRTFDWLINQHKPEHFKELFQNIDKIFNSLNGQLDTKSVRKLSPDAYFGGGYNFIFEFDEFQHFTSARLNTFKLYPKNLHLNYSQNDWQTYCEAHHAKADAYRRNKKTSDFDFTGGRTNQRAYLDCFRDLLPQLHGLNPTLRISEFEVIDIQWDDMRSRKIIEKLLKEKIRYM